MRWCNGCKQKKPFAAFWKDLRTKDGCRSRCKVCQTKSHLAYIKRPHAAKRRQLDRRLWKYGLTKEAFAALQKRGAGFCEICRDAVAIAIDHDHRTGVVRGLLCSLCNTGLGSFRDDPALLRRAAEYLNEDARAPGLFREAVGESQASPTAVSLLKVA